MRGVPVSAVALTLCLGTSSVRAGVYNPAEPESVTAWRVRDGFEEFRSEVRIPLRQFGTPEGLQPIHRQYALIAALVPRGPAGNLTVEERLSLSAYLIRSRKYREAVTVLSPAQRLPTGRNNFLVYANLAAAEYLDGQASGIPDAARRALDYVSAAVSQWPREWGAVPKERRQWLEGMGWTKERFDWYRRAETYFQKLLRARAREPRVPPQQANPLGTDVEALFEGGDPPRPVRWVGASGKYEAGQLAKVEQEKLPADAIALVQQLLIWMPDDNRLYWLLGELHNARGEYLTAYRIFKEIGDAVQYAKQGGGGIFGQAGKPGAGPRPEDVLRRNENYPELPEIHRQHWFTVRAAKQDAEAKALEAARKKEGNKGAVVAPPAVPERKTADRTPPGGSRLPIDLRSLLVGFGTGVFIAVFGVWQLREIRRRRQLRAAAVATESLAQWSEPDEGVPTRPPEGKPG